MRPPNLILVIIVLAQFCGTSVWFAGNAVLTELQHFYHLPEGVLGHLTTAVQLGFISGTLAFAILNIADRFLPSRVFFWCALFAALSNAILIWGDHSVYSILALRFATGFTLAGIYPVGMKIAADYFEKGLGKGLGWLVGALVLGTASPHLIRSFTAEAYLPWKTVLLATSVLAFAGGLSMLLLVPPGPFRKPGQKLDPSVFYRVFRKREFRNAALGYFGHMWELYALWTYIPYILTQYQKLHGTNGINVSLWSFFIIGSGSLGCILGGYKAGSMRIKQTARGALLISCCCALLSPVMLQWVPLPLLLCFFLVWGITVVADSPLFSTLVAYNADPGERGSALTIVNSIGFFISVWSIQLLNLLKEHLEFRYLLIFLCIGPILGLRLLFGSGKTSLTTQQH